MKESASPPRTPHSHSPNEMKSHSPTAPALGTATSSSAETSVESQNSQLLAAPPFILPQSDSVGGNKSQLDIEFPKLTPPKSKVGWSPSPPGSRNHNRKSVSSDTSSNNNSLSEDICESHVNDNCNKSSQQQKTGSHVNSTSSANNQSHYSDKKQHQQIENDCEQSSHMSSQEYKQDERDRVIISPSRAQSRSPNFSQNDNNNNGSKSSSTVAASYIAVKGKPPLKNMGSSSSCEGGNTSSGFISRDSSSEQFVDQNGIDLVQFFKETLNKNAKDRNMLMKIERDLIQLAVDQT